MSGDNVQVAAPVASGTDVQPIKSSDHEIASAMVELKLRSELWESIIKVVRLI
jgi:hypothetical protein